MGRRMTRAAALFLATATLLAFPATARAQQDPVRRGPDTTVVDTLPADTLLTPRERALRRLRALPASPIQRPPSDTVAGDTLAPDTLPGDTGAAEVPVDTLAPEQPPAADTPAVRPVAPPVPGEEPLIPPVLREDSIRALLQALEGYAVTEYQGQAAEFEAVDNRLRLLGESRVVRDARTLETDSVLVFAGDRGVVCGYGNPILSGEADPLESATVCFDIDRNLGEAVGARTKFTQGATWYVRGADNRVYLLTGEEENKLYGSDAAFTSCDLPEPHYVFKARSLKMVEGDMMVARNITLEFEDVPVFWLPWMVQSMKRGRRSGLLMPEFGTNDIVRNSTGYNRHISNIGFYWAINDYLGARSTFEWYSDNWTSVEAAVAYAWRRQFLRGSWTARQYWRDEGRRDLTIHTSNNWEPDERTRLQLNGSYATSSDFVRESSFDPRELNRQISASGSVSRSFDWGQMTLGVQRNQNIITEKTDLTLPSFSLNLQPITLFSNEEGTLNLTWSGSGSAERRDIQVDEFLSPSERDQTDVTADARHSLNFGRLSLSQSVQYGDLALGLLRPVPDTAEAPGGYPGEILLPEATQDLRWSTSVSYQQQLWTGTTLTPSVSIGGNQIRNDETGGTFIAAPNRVSASAGLSTTIFGFWPGFGEFERIRHKISPSLSYQYSPTANANEIQEQLFGISNLREQNRVTLRFNQTFEAKVRSEEDTDSLVVESSVVDDAGPEPAPGAAGEPQRLPQAEKVMLLSLTTSGPFVYDFVAAREDGRGFLTDQVSNSLRSDLLQNLTVDFTHDLFEEGEEPDDGGVAPRAFSPYLTRVNASFRIDQDFWLFRLLREAAGLAVVDEPEPEPEAAGVADSQDPTIAGEMDEEEVPGTGSIVPGREVAEDGVRSTVGGWQASLNYSLNRFRPAEGAAERDADQTLSGNMSFKPTDHWSLRWSTSYSFSAGEFNSHVLTLTRDLHRWQANFDFIKAQNGNFMFTFRVQLTDNPDLKLDYDQRTDPSERRVGTGSQ